LLCHSNRAAGISERALARINFFKSRLIYESFSDSSRDVDLVSKEILLSDLRFDDCPANKRSNVFTQILQPMEVGERNSPLQAEVHFRATQTTNRFTILLNNMRLMGIFDWWLAVLEFISTSAENPLPVAAAPAAAATQGEAEVKTRARTKVFLQEEPLYPSAGVISRRAPIVESKGPVFELKLNITDSEFIIVADSSQSDSSTVILRSTTVIAFRPDMTDRPFSCNLNNAEVFSCVLGHEDESSLSIIDPVTINFEIGGRNSSCKKPSKGLLDIAEAEGSGGVGGMAVERTAEIQLQQLNIRLSYHDWLMFRAILDSFPRQAREAMYGKKEVERSAAESPARDVPINVQAQISQLLALGFSRDDCLFSLTECHGNVNDAALWLTQNASPIDTTNSTTAIDAAAQESSYLQGSPCSFTNIELKTSSINICIIDDCKDADVPLLEMTLSHLHLKHGFCGEGDASSLLSGSYYNRALSSWEPFLDPWKCAVDWRIRSIGSNGQKLSMNMTANNVVNFSLTSTLIELYQMVKTNWTEDYYNMQPFAEDLQASNVFKGFRRRRTPFVPFALINSTGCPIWFCTQTRMSGSHFGPSRARAQSGMEMHWKLVEPAATLSFQFEGRGKLRHLNTHDMKIHQIIVRVEGWQETTPVSVDRVGTYFRRALPEYLASLSEAGTELPPARVVFEVTLDGSARKLINVRSALLVENKLPQAVDLKLENTALRLGGEYSQGTANLSERPTILSAEYSAE
jgi:vacuolar protein sorting-associated protein 13D